MIQLHSCSNIRPHPCDCISATPQIVWWARFPLCGAWLSMRQEVTRRHLPLWRLQQRGVWLTPPALAVNSHIQTHTHFEMVYTVFMCRRQHWGWKCTRHEISLKSGICLYWTLDKIHVRLNPSYQIHQVIYNVGTRASNQHFPSVAMGGYNNLHKYLGKQHKMWRIFEALDKYLHLQKLYSASHNRKILC